MANSIKEYDLKRLELRDDDPVDVDQFDDETHDQVANTLVKLITEKEGGFAIGLEGSWGSGKSTVAKITEQKIEDSANDQNRYVFFTFDTWAHQGDPIRRSFLECLAGKLFKEEIINKRKWYRHVSKIRASEKKINTTSKPNVPFFSYIMAFYALLAPFILIWAHSEVSNGEITDAIKPALIFIGLPIITAFVTWIVREKCELKTKGLPVLPTFRYLKHEMTTEQSIKTKDATTIEFNDHFDRLLKVLEGNGKKLVVILDNLDRISSDEFISMWGTMRNFFTADKDSKRDRLLKNVYLIVPFDQKHINEIFNKSSKLRDEKDSEIGEEFVDKTFRLVLDVAQPINTNWKSFFTNEIKNAFGDQLKKKQLHDFQKLFDLHYQENDVSITPRRIKKFINDLILQVYERNGEIPPKYLALYILNKNKIKENANGLITGEIVHERTKAYLAGEDWVQNVAAAHYKVSPKNALQLVLDNRISNALLNNKTEEIKEIQDYIGFNDALSKVIEKNVKEWAETETEGFAKAAKTLGSINLNNQHVTDDIWRIFASKTKNVGEYVTLNKITGEGLSNIITNAPNNNLLETAIEHICKKIHPNVGEDVNAEKYSKDYFDLLLLLSKSIVSRVGEEKSNRYLSKINLPDDPRVVLQMASLFESQEDIQFDNYNLDALNIRSIQDEFLKNIDKGLNIEVLDNSLFTLFNTGLPIKWNAISDSINKRLHSDKLLDTYEYKILLSMLTYLRHNEIESAKTHIKKISTNDYLIGVLQKSDNDYELKAIIILNIFDQNRNVDKVLNRNRGNTPPFGSINVGVKELNRIFNDPSQYSELKESLTILFCNYGLVGILLKRISENSGHNKLFVEIFKELLEKNCLNGLSTNDVLNYYESLNLNNGNEYFEKFFKQIDEEELNVDEIDNLSKIKEKLLVDSIDSNSKFGSKLYQRCQELFNSLEREDWLNELKKEGHVLNLVRVLVESDRRKSFINRVEFRDALLDYTNEVLLNNNQPNRFSSDNWKLLPNAMSKAIRNTFYKRLYTRLIIDFNTSEISYNILKHYGAGFIYAIDPSDRPDKFVENVLLDLINSNVEERLEWIVDNIKVVKRYWSNSIKETKDKIKEALASKNDVEDNIAGKLKSIKDALEL
jgi:hypothetical protein